MRNLLPILLSILTALLVLTSAPASAAERVAVLEPSGSLDEAVLATLSDEARAGVLDALPADEYIIMTRESMAVMLEDMGIELACAEGECEVETARNVGAAYVVSGQVIELSGTYIFTLKFHETKAGALLATEKAQGKTALELVNRVRRVTRGMVQRGLGLPVTGAVSPVATASASGVDFGGGLNMDVSAKLAEKACGEEASRKGADVRDAKLATAARAPLAEAKVAWGAMASELEACTQLDYSERSPCITAAERWIAAAEKLTVTIPAGVELVPTACGEREAVFAEARRSVAVPELAAARRVLGRLRSGALSSALGSSSFESQGGSIGDLIKASAAQDQFGSGGLGTSGTGYGGGGSGYGVGGLGTKGIGSGSGASGVGFGSRGRKGEGAITAIGGDPIILGALDRSLIDAVVKRHMNQIRYCYTQELAKTPSLAGKMVLKFIIAKDGTVSAAAKKTSTLRHDTLEQCVVDRFMRMQFPHPKGGGIVIVSYPLNFSPG